MPSNSAQPRVDWVPGQAAFDALQVGEDLFPSRNRQDVIDLLIITAVSAILAQPWRPPAFPCGSRHRWTLPADVAMKRKPGNGGD